jgi:hypothetical protein
MERLDLSPLLSTGDAYELEHRGLGGVCHCVAIEYDIFINLMSKPRNNMSPGSAWRASSFFIYTFCGVAGVAWPLCRVQQKKKAANVRHIMEKNAPAKEVAAANKGLSDADRSEIERDVARAKQTGK